MKAQDIMTSKQEAAKGPRAALSIACFVFCLASASALQKRDEILVITAIPPVHPEHVNIRGTPCGYYNSSCLENSMKNLTYHTMLTIALVPSRCRKADHIEYTIFSTTA